MKSKIISKIANFANKNSFSLIFDESYVSDLHIEGEKVKCKFTCPICEKTIRCEHQNYWIVSNLEKHLKRHFFNVVEEIIVDYPSNTEEKAVEVFSKDNSDQLNEVLAD